MNKEIVELGMRLEQARARIIEEAEKAVEAQQATEALADAVLAAERLERALGLKTLELLRHPMVVAKPGAIKALAGPAGDPLDQPMEVVGAEADPYAAPPPTPPGDDGLPENWEPPPPKPPLDPQMPEHCSNPRCSQTYGVSTCRQCHKFYCPAHNDPAFHPCGEEL